MHVRLQGKMGNYFLVSLWLLSFVWISACTAPKESTTNSFVAPGYEKKKFKKIAVLVKVEQAVYQKKIEEAIVKELKDRGYNCISANENFTAAELGDTARIREKVIALGIDAALVLKYLGQRSVVTDEAHYNGTMYNVFGGTAVTVDLDTRLSKFAYFQGDFFTSLTRGTQWRSALSAGLSAGVDHAIDELATNTRKRLVADKIL